MVRQVVLGSIIYQVLRSILSTAVPVVRVRVAGMTHFFFPVFSVLSIFSLFLCFLPLFALFCPLYNNSPSLALFLGCSYVPPWCYLVASYLGWYTTTGYSTVPLRTGTAVHVLFCLLSSILETFNGGSYSEPKGNSS